MEEKVQEDSLDARLRDEAAYIDDAGFTSNVVRKLPARPVRHRWRAAILIGFALLAAAIAYRLSGGGWFIAEELTRFALLPVSVMWMFAAGTTLLVMAGGVAAVLSRARGRSR